MTEITTKPWGEFSILEKGSTYQVKKLLINPLQKLSLQIHERRSEHWTIVSGTARIFLGDDSMEMGINQSIYIPKGVKHRICNLSSDDLLVVIETQVGTYLGEDDIVRLEDDYGRK